MRIAARARRDLRSRKCMAGVSNLTNQPTAAPRQRARRTPPHTAQTLTPGRGTSWLADLHRGCQIGRAMLGHAHPGLLGPLHRSRLRFAQLLRARRPGEGGPGGTLQGVHLLLVRRLLGVPDERRPTAAAAGWPWRQARACSQRPSGGAAGRSEETVERRYPTASRSFGNRQGRILVHQQES